MGSSGDFVFLSEVSPAIHDLSTGTIKSSVPDFEVSGFANFLPVLSLSLSESRGPAPSLCDPVLLSEFEHHFVKAHHTNT